MQVQSATWAQALQLLRSVPAQGPRECVVLSSLSSSRCTPRNGRADTDVKEGVQAACCHVRIPVGGLPLTKQSSIKARRPGKKQEPRTPGWPTAAPHTVLLLYGGWHVAPGGSGASDRS